MREKEQHYSTYLVLAAVSRWDNAGEPGGCLSGFESRVDDILDVGGDAGSARS